MHGGLNYIETLRVLINIETVFHKSGSQGNTLHEAEVTYREDISSARIQQEAKLHVCVCCMSSGSRYINISSDVAKNHASSWSIKNAGKNNKTSIWPISSYLDRTRLINDANVYVSVRMKRLSSSELRSPFSASVVCLFCNKTINNNNKTRRCKKARPL